MNWQTRKLGEICKIIGGGTPSRVEPSYWEGYIPWITMEDLQNGLYIYDSKQKITEVGLNNSNAQLVPKDSVILSCTASVGNVAINKVPITTNQQFNSFVCGNDIIPEFLAFSLMNNKSLIKRLGGLATVRFINKKVISNLSIQIPNILIQQQIVDRLDVIRKLQELNNKEIEKAEELFESVLIKDFNEGLRYWSKTKLGNIVTFSQLGLIKSKQLQVDKGTPYLKMDSIQLNGELLLDKAVYVTANAIETNNFKLRDGDFLFNTRNTPELVGKSAVFSGNDVFLFNNNILRLRFRGLLPVFLNAYLHTQNGKSQLNTRKKGTTSVSAIYQSNLFTVQIPLPPISVQQKIVQRLGVIRNHQASLKVRKDRLSELFNAALNKAMKGELVN